MTPVVRSEEKNERIPAAQAHMRDCRNQPCPQRYPPRLPTSERQTPSRWLLRYLLVSVCVVPAAAVAASATHAGQRTSLPKGSQKGQPLDRVARREERIGSAAARAVRRDLEIARAPILDVYRDIGMLR